MKLATLLTIALLVASPAVAQTVTSLSKVTGQEVVMDVSGRILAPWTKGKTCKKDSAGRETCRFVVINPKTREIARVGDIWSTRFAPTGNRSEVARLETTMAKAIRTTQPTKPEAQ